MVQPGHESSPPPWMKVVLVVAVYALPLLAAVRPVTDWDLWWHLRVGEWIVQHGQVTTNDPFSVWGSERSWVAYSWLFEVVVYRLHQWQGLSAILVFRAALALAIVGAFHYLAARREPRFLIHTGLALAAALAVFPLFSERPWLFSILFTTLTVAAVLDLREGRRGVLFWLLPVVFALWANLHIQFLYGLVILGLGCGVPVLDRLFGVKREGDGADVFGSPGWKRLVALTGVCLAATLANPYGVRVYAVMVDYATQTGAFRMVLELMPPTFQIGWDWVVLALALASAWALWQKSGRSTFEGLLLLASAVLWLRARRDMWMVALSAVVVLARVFPAWREGERPRRLPLWAAAVASALVVGVGVLLGWSQGLTPEQLRRVVREGFPEKNAGFKGFPDRAAAVVEERGYPGPIFNSFNWGGFLIWRLPHLQVTIDGRTNLHTDERIARSLRTWAAEEGWDADPELWAAGVVIAEASSNLAARLRKDPERFEMVYEDPQAVVFLVKKRGR